MKSVIKKIYNISLGGTYIKSIWRKIYLFIKKGIVKIAIIISIPIKSLFMKFTPINDNTIIFLCFQTGYCCNPKAIADEIIKRRLAVNIFWMINGKCDRSDYPQNLRLVKKGSYKYYRALASSKVIVDNTLNLQRAHVRKKKGQYLLQTWHGSLGIKRLDGDVVMNWKWKINAKLASIDTDFCISNSNFETEVFHNSYWNNVPILLYGHARNDILFETEEFQINAIKDKIYKEFGISDETKILLYAPTHRDTLDQRAFKLDYGSLYNALVDRFGGDWCILVRLHSKVKALSDEWLKHTPDFVIDATNYTDMQELLLIADIGLTDYSSWIFDFMLRYKPGFMIFDDLKEFESNRGLYYPLENTPFPLAHSNVELVERIINFDREKYQEKVSSFLVDKGCIEDGNASKRIVDKIQELMSISKHYTLGSTSNIEK